MVELALVALPVWLACAEVAFEATLALLTFVVALEDVDAAAVTDAAYKLTSVLVPSTSEPPVLVPRLIEAVEVHIVA